VEISRILGENPIIIDWVLQDLVGDKSIADAGAEGISAEQVFRPAIIKQMTFDDESGFKRQVCQDFFYFSIFIHTLPCLPSSSLYHSFFY